MNIRKNTEKIEPTFLKDSIIWSPILNHEYRIQYQQKEISIYFRSDNNINFEYFDFASGMGKTFKNKTANFKYFISKKSLPQSYQALSLPPIMFINNDCRQDQFHTIFSTKRIEITSRINNNFSISMTCDASKFSIKSNNQEIQQRYQKVVPKIPIITGKYPIFLDSNKPNFSYLEKMYNDLLRFNEEDKLKLQYNDSESLCHVRAHALHHLLALPAVKVYKFWDFYDWKNYVDDKAWIFHCAIMFIDENNQGWICDPWVGLNKKLLTLKEWAYRNDEPTPTKIMITSPAIINDIIDGEEAEASHFLRTSSKDTSDAFQAIATSIFPNNPEKPLSIKSFIHSFLKKSLQEGAKNKLIGFNDNGLFKSKSSQKTKESNAKNYKMCGIL